MMLRKFREMKRRQWRESIKIWRTKFLKSKLRKKSKSKELEISKRYLRISRRNLRVRQRPKKSVLFKIWMDLRSFRARRKTHWFFHHPRVRRVRKMFQLRFLSISKQALFSSYFTLLLLRRKKSCLKLLRSFSRESQRLIKKSNSKFSWPSQQLTQTSKTFRKAKKSKTVRLQWT